MENKHTPGPWEAKYWDPLHTNTDDKIELFAANEYWIADFVGEHFGIPRQTMIANAKLAAAAPDLLRSAKIALEDLDFLLNEIAEVRPGSYRATFTILELRAAISKATE